MAARLRWPGELGTERGIRLVAFSTRECQGAVAKAALARCLRCSVSEHEKGSKELALTKGGEIRQLWRVPVIAACILPFCFIVQ